MTTPQGRQIAFVQVAGQGPGIIFLGGFRSDMTGTKALFLEERARASGRAFLRIDYSGHGASGGRFEDGAIGDWAEDAAAALALTEGPQVLVGSSMGGWIALLLARRVPERVKGLVLIAAAPEFPAAMWAEFSPEQRAELTERGLTHRPSEYGEPYPITRRLIDEARGHGIFDRLYPAPFPVRLLQGTADVDVPQDTALRLLAHLDGPDVRLTLVRNADHRFSDAACLDLIERAVAEVS